MPRNPRPPPGSAPRRGHGEQLNCNRAEPMLELARQRADGVINRSKTRDTPCFPLAAKGRLGVWNSHRGNHLGQRSCASAKTGRTYGRKRSDQSTAQITLRGGGRPHMAAKGRLGVWNSHRGNHLGQRSCASAKTDALSNYNAEFGEMGANGADKAAPLADQQVARPV